MMRFPLLRVLPQRQVNYLQRFLDLLNNQPKERILAMHAKRRSYYLLPSLTNNWLCLPTNLLSSLHPSHPCLHKLLRSCSLW